MLALVKAIFSCPPPRNYTLKFDNVLSPPTMKWNLRPCIHRQTHTYTHKHIHTHSKHTNHKTKHTYTHKQIHTHSKHTKTDSHTHTHTYAHTHTHTHTHTHSLAVHHTL